MRIAIRLAVLAVLATLIHPPFAAVAAKKEKDSTAFTLTASVTLNCPGPDYCEPAEGTYKARGAIVAPGLLLASGAAWYDGGLTLVGDGTWAIAQIDVLGETFDLWVYVWTGDAWVPTLLATGTATVTVA